MTRPKRAHQVAVAITVWGCDVPDGTGDVTKTHTAWKLSRGALLTPSPPALMRALAPVFAGGSIYFPAEQGVTTVIAPGREFRRLATNRLDGGLLASMAVSGGSLFLRTDSYLYRIMEIPR